MLETQANAFIWASGIEDTFVPQTKPGHRSLDEYELIGHYEHWREDLALARDLGVQALRWGVPWYRVEPQQGQFDWSWTDQVLPYLVVDLGITPIIDLVHYGCPFWLQREFASDDYPDAVAAYAAAFAHRYTGLVHFYTPLNEPLMNALMCGKRGRWPPYLRGDRGFVRIMLQLVKGIIRTVAAIKELSPDARMVHVEAVGLSRATQVELQALAEEHQHRSFLSYDLLTGRVGPEHPLYSWLLRNGASADDLDDLRGRHIPLDILGLNFYPQWSTTQLYLDRRGRLAYRAVGKDGAGFRSLVEDYFRRYRLPIMITETSARGSHKLRAQWLRASVAAVKELRQAGVPVLGYTWFPLFTMIDWRYRTGQRPLEKYRVELGLYTLAEGQSQRWQATRLVEEFRSLINRPSEAIGELKSSL